MTTRRLFFAAPLALLGLCKASHAAPVELKGTTAQGEAWARLVVRDCTFSTAQDYQLEFEDRMRDWTIRWK